MTHDSENAVTEAAPDLCTDRRRPLGARIPLGDGHSRRSRSFIELVGKRGLRKLQLRGRHTRPPRAGCTSVIADGPSFFGWDKLNVMFRPTSVLIQFAGLAAAALCLEGSRTPPDRKPDKLETQTITATILGLEELLDEAESHHRLATVEQLIADDYHGITVGGGIIAKRDVMAAVRGSEQTSSQSTEREVRVLAEAAVYTALVLDRGVDEKTQEPYALATRVMDVWQKRGREWKLVNDQATGVTLDGVP